MFIQRKKEIDRYVPRGRHEQLDKVRGTSHQIEGTSADGPDVDRVKSESPTSIYKKIKVTDDISDKPTLLDRTTDSRCSDCLNEMENDDKKSQGDRAYVHEDNLQQIAKKSQDADVPVIQNTSKHKHIPVDINELDTEGSASVDKCIPDKNINPENKGSQIISTWPVESSLMKVDSFIPTSNVLEANITTVDLISDSSATNLPEFDVPFASSATNFKEPQVVNSQSFEHNQALTKNVHSDNCTEDVVKLDNNGVKINTKTAENTACTDVVKATVNPLGNKSIDTTNSQSEGHEVYEIRHSEMVLDNCDMKGSEDSNTNEVNEKLSNFDTTNEIIKSTLTDDLVKCPKDFKDLQKNQIDFGDTVHEERQVIPEVSTDPPNFREDCAVVNPSTECAVRDNSVHFSEDACKTNNANENMSEICVFETDNHSAETYIDKANVSGDRSVDAERIGEHDTLSAEQMEITDSR